VGQAISDPFPSGSRVGEPGGFCAEPRAQSGARRCGAQRARAHTHNLWLPVLVIIESPAHRLQERPLQLAHRPQGGPGVLVLGLEVAPDPALVAVLQPRVCVGPRADRRLRRRWSAPLQPPEERARALAGPVRARERRARERRARPVPDHAAWQWDASSWRADGVHPRDDRRQGRVPLRGPPARRAQRVRGRPRPRHLSPHRESKQKQNLRKEGRIHYLQ